MDVLYGLQRAGGGDLLRRINLAVGVYLVDVFGASLFEVIRNWQRRVCAANNRSLSGRELRK